MNKNILVLFFILLMLIPISNIKAYNNKYFDVTMPKGYKITTEKDGTYQWVNETAGSNYVVSVRLKTTNKDILDFNKEEKAAFIEGVIHNLEDQYYLTYNKKVPVSLVYHDEENFGKYQSLSIKLKIDNFLQTKYTMNQYIYIIESENLLYSIVYSATDKTLNNEELKKIKDNFIINDKMPKVMFIEKIKNISLIALFIAVGYSIAIIKYRKIIKK